MNQLERLIPQIRESSKELIRLTNNPDPSNIGWFIEVGEHLAVLGDIHDGIDPQSLKKPSQLTRLKRFIKKALESTNE